MSVRRWMTAAVLGVLLPLAPAVEAAPRPAAQPVAQQQNDDSGRWGLLGLFGLLGLLGLARRSPKPGVPAPRPARRRPRHEAQGDPMARYPSANQPPRRHPTGGAHPPPEQTAPPTGAAPEGRRRRY